MRGVLIKCCIKSNALVTTISYPLQLSSVVKPFDYNLALSSRVVYICSSLFQLTVESCDLSQAQKKKYLWLLQDEQIHKMKTHFTQNLSLR